MKARINPEAREKITLGNWRVRPQSQWAFQNVHEFVPVARIEANRVTEEPQRDLGTFADLIVADKSGVERQLEDYLLASQSDCLIIMREGEIIGEWSSPTCDPTKPHIIFSISKSITGLLAGFLVDQGLMKLDDLVETHVPEVRGSAFEGATIEDLLCMSLSIEFEEHYLDKTGMFDRYRRAMLWNPEVDGDPVPDLKQFLYTIKKAPQAHGVQHDYKSPVADMAGVLLERVSGRRYSELMSELLWKPLGAHSDSYVTVDRIGTPRASGGIAMTSRDLARIGEMMRLGGNGIVPQSWVRDIWAGSNHARWAKVHQGYIFPDGSYRYFWYNTGHDEIVGMGVHGQWLWVHRPSGTVIVRNACEGEPVSDDSDQSVIVMMRAICSA